MILWAFAALALSILLFWQSNRTRRDAGLPTGRVIYSDREGWMRVEKVLYDEVTGLAGKPDFVVKKGKTMVPVEMKTGRTPAQPYEGHIYQLAAYCLLVERQYRQRPPYGIIHYPDRTFTVDFSSELEEDLLEMVAEMRNDADQREIPRSHDEAGRCRGCGYLTLCNQSLV
jgi:CRISPR-associated exonuclease Cas4